GRTVDVFDSTAEDPEDPDGVTARPEEKPKAPRPRPVLSPVFQLGPPEKWPAGTPWVPPVAFTPDGRRLLVRRPNNRVQLWDAAARCRLNTGGGGVDGVTCLAVAPDGLTAVAAGRFGRGVMWDLE